MCTLNYYNSVIIIQYICYDWPESEWKWDPLEATTDVNITNNSLDVLFHPVSSQGTGAIRGDMPFTHGQIYYWEIEVIGSVTATDIVTFYK